MISFTKEETLILLEAARIALSDAEVFDMIATGSDLRDRQIAEVRDKLVSAMDGTSPIQLNAREESEALIQDGDCGNDYLLAEEHTSAWVRVGNVSVYICRADEGVAVDLRPTGEEDADPIGSTWATYAECDPIKEAA